ncbi:hypothetical protein C8J56DRAFT_1042417 [Mycena floridula]|nr:hypothetical protein C8J56DRAFT_1042417 [Mycena floridula]
MSNTPQTGPVADSDVTDISDFLIQTAAQWLVHGVYSSLVVIVLHKLWTQPAHLPARGIMIVGIIILFVFATTAVAITAVYDFVQFPTLGFNPPNVDGLLTGIIFSNNLITRFNFLMSDSIVLWRAWVLWPDNIRVRALLILCLLASCGRTEFNPTGPRTLIMTLSGLLTNLVSTLLMGYKVWEYRVEVKNNLGIGGNKSTKVERILILLTESGTIYCLLWLVYCFILVTSQNYQSLAYQLVSLLLPQLTGIYPLIIVLLIAFEKANLESTINLSLSHRIQFVNGHDVTTTQTSNDVELRSIKPHVSSIPLGIDGDDGVRPVVAETQFQNSQWVHSTE